jgi:hypothetical protein
MLLLTTPEREGRWAWVSASERRAIAYPAISDRLSAAS